MGACNILGILKEANGKRIKTSYHGMNSWTTTSLLPTHVF